MSKNVYTQSVSARSRVTMLAASVVLAALPVAAQSGPAAGRVLAQAVFTSTLDAKTLKPGASFTAKLDGKVHLANGTTLPSGTVLHGSVVNDDLNIAGDKKLALRFTTADIKGKQTVPIRATILGLRDEADLGSTDPNVIPGNGAVGIDSIGVPAGIDLHSRFASENSGVLVATGKNDVKLKVGSAVDLAIVADAGSSAGGTTAGN